LSGLHAVDVVPLPNVERVGPPDVNPVCFVEHVFEDAEMEGMADFLNSSGL
jgi:hypothetical protein